MKKLGGLRTEIEDMRGVLDRGSTTWAEKKRERERSVGYPMGEYEKQEQLETWNERCKAILPRVNWSFDQARTYEWAWRGMQREQGAAREQRQAEAARLEHAFQEGHTYVPSGPAPQRKALQRDLISTASYPDEHGRRVYGLIAGRVWLGERGGGEMVASIQALLQPVLRSEQDMRRAQEQRRFAQEVAMYLFQNHGLMLQGGNPTFQRIEWLEIWEMTPNSLEYARAFAQGLTPGADEPRKRARDMTGRDISALVDRLGLKAPRPRPRADAQTTHGEAETP